MPPFLFFWGFFLGAESWAAAHGLYRCTVYRLLSEPMSTRLLNRGAGATGAAAPVAQTVRGQHGGSKLPFLIKTYICYSYRQLN